MSHAPFVVRLTAACLTAAACITGCSSEPTGTTLTVFAAASLQPTFTELGRSYEAAHPGTTVRFTFAGSSSLVQQITDGAPGDVLATADQTTMGRAVTAGSLSGDPTVFATNVLEIAVAPGNPLGVTSLADLARVITVVCAPQVPCGAAAQQLATAAGTTLSPVSEELSVSDVLTKVSSGQADAGLVYVTDVAASDGAVTGVTVPQAGQVVNRYPIGVLTDAQQPGAAGDFVAYVTGPQGRAVLSEAGFGTP